MRAAGRGVRGRNRAARDVVNLKSPCHGFLLEINDSPVVNLVQGSVTKELDQWAMIGLNV